MIMKKIKSHIRLDDSSAGYFFRQGSHKDLVTLKAKNFESCRKFVNGMKI